MVENGFGWLHRLGPAAFRQGSSFFTNNFRKTVRAKVPTLVSEHAGSLWSGDLRQRERKGELKKTANLRSCFGTRSTCWI